MPNSEFHVQKWSFDPKFSNLVHKCTSGIFSCQFMNKGVSIQNEVNFMIFDEKCKCKLEWVCWCHEKFDEENVFQVWRNVFRVKVEKWWSEWKVEFWNMELFLTWNFLFVNEIFPKWMSYPLFLTKTELCFSLLSSSLIIQSQMVQMNLKGSKYGVYICA